MSSTENQSEKSPQDKKAMTKEELIELLRKLPPKARQELLMQAKQRKEDKSIE